MKTLIAYYSRTGNNEKAAKELKEKLGSDIEKVTDVKGFGGAIGFLRAGMGGARKSRSDIRPVQNDPSQYDLVVLLYPLWAGRMPPGVRTYVHMNRDKFKKIALFSVSGSGEENKEAVSDLEEEAEKDVTMSLLLKDKEVKDGSYREKLEGFVKSINAP